MQQAEKPAVQRGHVSCHTGTREGVGVTSGPSPLLPLPVLCIGSETGLQDCQGFVWNPQAHRSGGSTQVLIFERNEAETKPFQGMRPEVPVRQHDQAQRFQRAGWWALERHQARKQAELGASPATGKSGTSPARGSPKNLGAESATGRRLPSRLPPWRGTGSSSGKLDAAEWAGRAEPLSMGTEQC